MEMLTPMLKKHLVVVILSVLFVVGIFSGIMTTDRGALFSEVRPVVRISEIDGPRIDDEAAMVVQSAGFVAPVELYLFLLVAYVALLLFNFSFTFETVLAPQWRLEGLITLAALLAWYWLDPDGRALWFPFAILKSGLLLFAGYVVLLEKRHVSA